MKFLFLNLTIFLVWSSAAISGGYSVSEDTLSRKVNVEGVCNFKGSSLLHFEGGENNCRSDNLVVSSLFLENDINLSNSVYKLVVTSIQLPRLNSQESTNLIDYSITFSTVEKNLQSSIDKIAAQSFIKTRLPESKMPVNCYIYGDNNRISALCHYGLFADQRVENEVKDLKSNLQK